MIPRGRPRKDTSLRKAFKKTKNIPLNNSQRNENRQNTEFAKTVTEPPNIEIENIPFLREDPVAGEMLVQALINAASFDSDQCEEMSKMLKSLAKTEENFQDNDKMTLANSNRAQSPSNEPEAISPHMYLRYMETGTRSQTDLGGWTDRYSNIGKIMNEKQFNFGKIVQQMEKLERRVATLEQQVAKCSGTERTVGRVPGSLEGTDLFNPSDNISSSVSTLEGISSSLSIYPASLFQSNSDDGHGHQERLSRYSRLSSSHPLPSQSLYMAKTQLKRADLDYFCIEILKSNPKPSSEQLEQLAENIREYIPGISGKDLLSKVREWFRKRREYMSQRIFQSCEMVLASYPIETEDQFHEILSRISEDESVLSSILGPSNLEITCPTVARAFCLEKVKSFIESKYRSYRQRRV